MSRQRVIDESFWDDPDLVEYTGEIRFFLVLLLTNRFSNIIGIYRVNWRSLGAPLGWTYEQTINTAALLEGLGGCRIDVGTGWIWVTEWWKHNSFRGALTGNVAKKARLELEAIPSFWTDEVIEWLKKYDLDGSCEALIRDLQGSYKGLGKPMQGSGATTNPNPTSINTTNPTVVFPTFLNESQRQAIAEKHGNHPDLQTALDEMWAFNKVTRIESPIRWVASVLAKGVNKTDAGLQAAEIRKNRAA